MARRYLQVPGHRGSAAFAAAEGAAAGGGDCHSAYYGVPADALTLLLLLACLPLQRGLCQSTFTFLPSAPSSSSNNSGFSCSTYCGSPRCADAPGCQVADGALRLTPNPAGLGLPRGPADWAARYMRDEAVELWDAASGAPASFATFFLLRVSRIDGYVPGDGMAFLIAPDKAVPPRSDGAGLGVFQDPGAPSPAAGRQEGGGGSGDGVLAIAFDMLPSFPDDPADAPFVSLLVRRGRPANYTQLDTSTLQVVFVGNTFGVWAEYDAGSLSMQVSMLLWPGPVQQVDGDAGEEEEGLGALGRRLRSSARSMFTVRGLNLTERVRQTSFLGFAAGTKGAAEVHEVFYWEFQATRPGESLPPPSQHPGADDVPAGPAGHSSSTAADHGHGSGMRRTQLSHAVQIALATAGSIVGLALLVVAAVWVWLMRGDLNSVMFKVPGSTEVHMRNNKTVSDSNNSRSQLWALEVESDGAPSPRSFTYEELREATDNFSTEAVLGEGGFGKVYKGFLKNGGASPGQGSVVAVKRLSNEHSKQGEKEFLAEVTIIRQLRHQNLVPLRGWCQNKRKGELLLVYDYMPNGSLDQHVLEPLEVTESVHKTSERTTMSRHTLSWPGRYHAIKGVASALLYLHEDWEDAGLQQCVVHRDVKSSNVLLDAEWNARLGDFGLARFVQRNKSAQTASTIVGTRGYLAPEFQYTGRISVQADVYSFGVLALEVAAGRRPVEWFRPPSERFLVKWVRSLHQSSRLEDAADPALLGNFEAEEMRLILHLGLACTVNEPADRPSMRQVVHYLSGDSSSLVLPTYLQNFSIPSARNPLNFHLLNFSSVSWNPPGGEGASTDNEYVCTAPAAPVPTKVVVRVDETPRSV